MNKLATAMIAALLFTAACNSTDIGNLTEAGLLIADPDNPEKAHEMGQAAGKITGAVGDMPFETERGIGGGIAVKSFATAGPLYPNDELQKYVNLVGRVLARQSTRPDVPYTIAVVQNDEINAWAAPGGYIFLTTGAIKNMDDEAQLAGVLAHEMYHVTDYHMVKMLRRSQFFEGAAQAASASTDKDMTQYTAAIDQGTDLLFTKGLDQGMEYESDVHGTELAAGAGYDPTGLARYLDNIRVATGGTGGGWLTSTHPSVESRLTKVRALLDTELVGIEGAIARDRFQDIKGRTLR